MLEEGDPLSIGPLTGQTHQDATDELWQAYLDATRCWRPRLVNVVGETGVGKTRVVQEFYKRVVSSDPYWPRALRGLNQRKTVIPSRQTWEGSPTLLWLGLSCFALPDGRPWPALEDGLRRQLTTHARGLLLRNKRSAAVRKAATQAATSIGSFIGAEAIKSLIDLSSGILEVKEIAEALANVPTADDHASGSDVIDAVLKIAALANAEGQPLVIVLDDAHNADPLALDVIERLFDKTQAIFVIATSWPTALSHQREEDECFGAWLTRFQSNSAVTSLSLPPLAPQVLAEMATKALRRTGRHPVDPEAAAVLGERARGNGLLLSQLLSMVIANDASATRHELSSLALLPVEPKEIFREAWLRFLAPSVQGLLEAAAVLGTPVDENMLIGATAELRHLDRTSFGREINSALAAGWLVAIPDPYSPHRRLRFSERLLADVAAAFATQLIPSTRDRMVSHAALCALDASGAYSEYARTAALQHAAALLENNGPRGADDLAVAVFTELAGLLWRRDRSRAADLMQRACDLELSHRCQVDIELLLNTSVALANIGNIDAALGVFNRQLPAAYLIKAEQANMHERFCEARTAARDGLEVELVTSGSIASNPIFEPDDSVILCLVRELCAATYRSSSREVADQTRDVLISAVRQLRSADELLESSEVAKIASDFGIFNTDDVARLKGLGVPFVDGPGNEEDITEFDRLIEARLLILGGHLEEADRRLGCIPLYLRSHDAVAVAEDLVLLGGPKYAKSLGHLALDCGHFKVALDAFERSLRYSLEQGQPVDASPLQEIRSYLVESAVCAGAIDQGRLVADRSLEIARRAQNQYELAKALLGIGHVHLAQRQFDDAERAFDAALHSLPHDAQTSIDAARVSAARCDIYAAKRQWAEIQELLASVPTPAFWNFARHSWRLRGWRLIAGWRCAPERFERSLLDDINLADDLARPALQAALVYLGREMDGPTGGASVLWAGSGILLGLVGTLLESGRDDLAIPLLSG